MEQYVVTIFCYTFYRLAQKREETFGQPVLKNKEENVMNKLWSKNESLKHNGNDLDQ